jgi:hypothetical protein
MMTRAVMDTKVVNELLGKLDGSGSAAEFAAAARLRELGPGLPRLLLQKFRSARTWQARASSVYHALKYARESDDAVTLGREALRDRSKAVRYRGAMLLACSLRKDLLPELERALESWSGPGEADVRAAIDAIENQNQNYFIDREHTGRMVLRIN